ncbi:MAG: hypothetical protein AAB221_04225, partial [Bacteroidota bacterium]
MKLSGKFDVRTGPNINLTFGGNLDWNTYREYDWANSLFNYENNQQVVNNTWRAYAKFTQKFNSPDEDKEEQANATIKNAFYTLQVDYSKFTQKVQDPIHKDNIFNYGYVGKFTTYTKNSYTENSQKDSITGLYGRLLNGFQDTLYAFTPSDINPTASDYTQSYYNLYSNPVGHYENRDQVLNGGGLVNGYLPGDLTNNVYGQWTSPGSQTNPGQASNGYSLQNQGQFSILASGSADLMKNHEVSAGFEYEQRTDRAYSVGPVALWQTMRQLTNNHILQLDKNNPKPVYYDIWGTPTPDDDTIYGGTINYPRLYDGASQALFDFNLRKELGLPTNGLDWVDLNNLDPNTFSTDMFSPDELLNNGDNYVGY